MEKGSKVYVAWGNDVEEWTVEAVGVTHGVLKKTAVDPWGNARDYYRKASLKLIFNTRADAEKFVNTYDPSPGDYVGIMTENHFHTGLVVKTTKKMVEILPQGDPDKCHLDFYDRRSKNGYTLRHLKSNVVVLIKA